MRLDTPFLKLPIRFDPDALAAEVRALPDWAWSPHPTGFVGNEAVRLVSPGGEQTDDFSGPMGPTTQLALCPYIQKVMAEIGGVWGRSRLMGLAAGADVPSHIDVHYYWRTHLRLHIPVITNPGVSFTCGSETVHMAAGECWAFDSFQRHCVENKGSEQRIHLVLDTVGGGDIAHLIARAGAEARLVLPGQGKSPALKFEKMNSPLVMSPWEIRCHLSFLLSEAKAGPKVSGIFERMDQFVDDWASAWTQFGPDEAGRQTYSRLIETVRGEVLALGSNESTLRNDWPLHVMLESLIFQMALAAPARPAISGTVGSTLRGYPQIAR
ncbi:MAG TPA: aspartyl/asparaginyl beta-hydroxylase domain-containing protein [Sphingomicrobium sp.]|nr:aspartyl/asparaginyl beta-hydroxylase domain-containing protein [Sphingomicrobium sp.]